MDSRVWGCILHVRPHANREDIRRCKWINECDLFIEFTDGEKCIYDSITNYFRCYTYTIETITEEQWRFEFRDKLKSMLQHKYISQDELAQMVGTSQQMISRYISGDAMPGLYMFHKITAALNCNDNDLLFQDY